VKKQGNSNSTIAVFSFPLPSQSNYALLANLVTILSHIYSRVIVVTGDFISILPHIIDDLRLANKSRIFIYDLRVKLPSRDEYVPFIIKLFIYIKIQVNIITASIKLRNIIRFALFFIGIPHMLPVILLLRLMKKRTIVY